MADGLHSKQLSLDTNVLLNLAAHYDFAVNFKEEFQNRGYALKVVPGVMAELIALVRKGNDVESERASAALDSLREWRITPIILTDVERAYRKNFMAIMEDRRILPPNEINDVRILAETAIAEIAMLVTSDSGILDADQSALSLAFEDSGLRVVHPAHPRKLAANFKKR